MQNSFNMTNLRSLTALMKRKLQEMKIEAEDTTRDNYLFSILFGTRWLLRQRYEIPEGSDDSLGLQIIGFVREGAKKIKYTKTMRFRAARDFWDSWMKDSKQFPFDTVRLESMLEHITKKSLDKFSEQAYEMSRTNVQKYLDSRNPFGPYRPRLPEMGQSKKKERIRLNDVP